LFVIGNGTAADMTDANALAGSHLAIIGNSGSGKSYAIRRLLEDSWGQAVHIVFDVEDEFHTLRERFSYVLVGGSHGDITATDPCRLARRVLTSGTSVIIQLNDLSMENRRVFISNFLQALMSLHRSYWRRALVVIDEAHDYVPEGKATASSEPILNLMAQGRKRGFVGVLASQRAARVSKSALGQCSNWMIGRVASQNDKRVAADQLGFKIGAREMEGLRTLPVGTFWRAGPAWGGRDCAAVPRARTKHLQLGQTWAPPVLEDSKLDGLREPAPAPPPYGRRIGARSQGRAEAIAWVVAFAVLAGMFVGARHLLTSAGLL
jgi:hypothetical protein